MTYSRAPMLERGNQKNLIAPITSDIRDIPSEAILSPEDGIPFTCAANFEHLQTVTKTPIRTQ